MTNEIRGAVFRRFPNISAFAEAIGWTRQKASRIVNGLQRPTAAEMEEMAPVLGIDNAEGFMAVFFPAESTK
jgi:transcriptional regulator with XRE-family HTH domain